MRIPSYETPSWRDKHIIERGNYFFHYEYDASEARWVLKKIARIEKDNVDPR
jgi:hypothetical protein